MFLESGKTIEIRGHARGGQGMVTAFEMLAKIFSYRYDFEVQAFPFFGVERTGAPIQAYLRISPGPILNRSHIYQPDLVVVFDEGLMEQPNVLEGVGEDTLLLINSELEPVFYRGKAARVCTVPATPISIERRLGSKSLPIVNAAMVGALLKILGADVALAGEIIAAEVPVKPEENVDSARVAFTSVRYFLDPEFQGRKSGTVAGEKMPENGSDPQSTDRAKPDAAQSGGSGSGQATSRRTESDEVQSVGSDSGGVQKAPVQAPVVFPDVPFWDKPMSMNKTGNWRVVTPQQADRRPPCTDNCPAGTDVRAFVQLASDGKFDEAWQTIYAANPFPSICGRVCPHFCQQNCNRIFLDGRLNIGAIERFIGDHAAVSGKLIPESEPITRNEAIAVVGSGPAGLTAALRLRRMGYPVTVFEALPEAGGMMRSGIPAFRLPPDVIDREVARIEQQGVEIRTGKKVTLDELDGDYAAIITAIGSHVGSGLGIGADGDVIDGIAFLRAINIDGKPMEFRPDEPVAVIGGGNTAIDVSRTVLRLGGKPTIYYRRTRQEMPAIAEEVEEALREGVPIRFLTAPVALSRGNDGMFSLTIRKMELGEPDASGRRRPVPVEGSDVDVPVGKVIAAIGQWSDPYVFAGREVKAVQGRVRIGEPDHNDVIVPVAQSAEPKRSYGQPQAVAVQMTDTFSTPVFCAGDMAWGGTIVEAIGSGNEVALEVNAWLNGEKWSKTAKKNDVVTATEMNFSYYLRVPSHVTPINTPAVLKGNFSEVAGGLTAEQITGEASRCLHCGDCFSCGNCLNFCPDAAMYIDEDNRLRIDYDFCKGCGICVNECPCASMQFAKDQKHH